MKKEQVIDIRPATEAEKAPVTLKMQMSTQEQVNVMSNGTETKIKTVTFSFNTSEVECVKTKSGDYVIRNIKK